MHDMNLSSHYRGSTVDSTNKDRFKNSMVQVIQKDKDKQEYEILKSGDVNNNIKDQSSKKLEVKQSIN